MFRIWLFPIRRIIEKAQNFAYVHLCGHTGHPTVFSPAWSTFLWIFSLRTCRMGSTAPAAFTTILFTVFSGTWRFSLENTFLSTCKKQPSQATSICFEFNKIAFQRNWVLKFINRWCSYNKHCFVIVAGCAVRGSMGVFRIEYYKLLNVFYLTGKTC